MAWLKRPFLCHILASAALVTLAALASCSPEGEGPVGTLAPASPAFAPASPVPAYSPEVVQLWRTWRQATALSLPLRGVLYVSQGWDGRDPTHYGRWRYAIDFIMLGPDGRRYAGTGARSADYYIWGQPVYAAAAGTVVKVENGLPDRLPGQPAAGSEAWGNHVVISHAGGEYSEYSHLKEGSIKVTLGQTVNAGDPIAEVGSSGYAYEPHLHFQLQASAGMESATTLPAVFAQYYEIQRAYTRFARSARVVRSVPREGQYVSLTPLLRQAMKAASHVPAL